MNYYRYFAARTVADALKNAYVYLISCLFSLLTALLLRNIGHAALAPATLEFLTMALIFNGLLPACYISIYLSAYRVFFVEKKQRSLGIILCSPAGLGEIFWGKTSGLLLSSFLLPVAVMLLAGALAAPQGLYAVLSWRAAAAFGLVCVMALAYTAVVGMALLSARDERIVTVALYAFVSLQVGLGKLTKAAAGGGMWSGVLSQYAAMTAFFVLAVCAAYYFYFSKVRVLESA